MCIAHTHREGGHYEHKDHYGRIMISPFPENRDVHMYVVQKS